MMIRYSRWLRLIISMAVTSFERYGAKPDIPVLVLLEEFNVLGYLEVIEAAADFSQPMNHLLAESR